MARFLSALWVEEFNTALAEVSLPGPDPDAGLAAVDGEFVVAQEVRGSPDGDLRLLLLAGEGTLQVEVEPITDDADHHHRPAGVTMALSYPDAVALSRGELTPAEALNAGKIRVRGDLSVLVAGQRLLDAGLRGVAGILTTTY
jgi:hypothetical protein